MSKSMYASQEAKGDARAERSILLNMVVLPPAIFILINVLFFVLGSDYPWAIWTAVGLLMSKAVYGLTKAAFNVTLLVDFALGLWCMLTIISAAGFGFYLDTRHLGDYRELASADVARGVDPLLENASAASAAVIHFTEDSFVDDRRTVGFVANGHIYCVAPVARSGHPTPEVYYWAAGIDCCEMRSNFDCGAARDPGPTAAILYHSRASTHFTDAVGVAATVHNVTSPAGAKLVGFISNYKDMADSVWANSLKLLFVGSGVHLAFSVLVAVITRRASKRDIEPRDLTVERFKQDNFQDGRLGNSALEWESFCFCLGPRWFYLSASKIKERYDIECWERRHYGNPEGDVKFFDKVFIAEDGGLKYEVEDFVKGIDWVTGFWAMVTPSVLIFNIVYILKTDLSYLNSDRVTVDWCITGFIVDKLARGFFDLMAVDAAVHVPATKVVAVFELVALVAKTMFLLFLIVEAELTTEERRRWSNISRVYWITVPSLSTFSAMQLLSYGVPSIMRLELVPLLTVLAEDTIKKDRHSFKATWDIVAFIASRLVFSICGFDAFLVKFRFAVSYVEADSMTIRNLFGALGFVLQLVGIVDLAFWNRRRLSDFVFGKADAKLSDSERADSRVYKWMLAKRMWKSSRGTPGLFSVAMLKFNDFDFQKLVLNERSKKSEGGRDVEAN